MHDPKNLIYLARLCDAICTQCGIAVRVDPNTGRDPLCKPCSYKERGRKKRILADATGRPGTLTLECGVCSRSYQKTRSRTARAKYPTCSAACRNKARHLGLILRDPTTFPHGETHKQWEGGKDGRDYGPHWKSQRDAARARDHETCQHCGKTRAEINRALEVHHIVRFVDFTTPEEANVLTNLVTLCVKCHRRADAALYQQRKQTGARRIWRPTRKQRRRARWDSFAMLACLLARNWRITSQSPDFEGERVSGVAQAISSVVTRPSKSRGLCDAFDRCQATTLLRLNAEIEADCFVFTLSEQDKQETCSYQTLLKIGSHKLISRARRIAFLDWADADTGGGTHWTDARTSKMDGCQQTALTWNSACGIGPRLPDARRRSWPVHEI